MRLLLLICMCVSSQCRPSAIQGGPVESRESKGTPTITHIPYYGGAKGQTLEIIESADGSIMTNILRADRPVKKPQSQFAKDISTIHQAALDIIRLHEQTKHKERLDDEEKERYDKGIELLNQSSKSLASMQQEDIQETEERSNLKFWFEKKKEKLMQKGGSGTSSSVTEEKEKEEENVGEETEASSSTTTENSDSVAINLPPPEASVAEAKPIGLAVAGAGGVAASKPIATAVVGPGGLAIARPVATAIAGVAPEEAILPLSGDGLIKIPSSKKDRCKGSKCSNKEDYKERDDEEYYGGFRIKAFF